MDILSTEMQFDLLGSLDCATLVESPILTEELNSLASRLAVAEQNLGATNTEVITLKKQYSLLQMKDYLLMQRIGEKCRDIQPVYVLYFYSNTGDCTDCRRMGEVLTYLRQTYPGLRVYSFDYNLELAALNTLERLRKVEDRMPAVVINNRAPLYGFKSLEEMQELMPELAQLASTTAATTTPPQQ